MRMETILDILKDCYKKNKAAYKTLFQNEVLGMTVYAKYNNKSYRITDVDWVNTPNSTFDRKGVKTSYVSYYKSHHNQTINDMHQPLLISRVKDRDLRGEAVEKNLSLIPELCRPTGLSEDMRGDFK